MIQSNVIVVSNNARFLGRANAMAATENHKVHPMEDIDVMMNDSNSDFSKVELVIIDATAITVDNDIVGIVQVVKQYCHQAYLMIVVGGKTRPEVTVFIKKSGANAVLLETEYHVTSKPEYIWSQAVRSPYVAIKSNELKAGTKLEYDVLHYMPMNKKFIKVIPKGENISEVKLGKMQDVSEFYISKNDFSSFMNYANENIDRSAKGIAQRCRLQFYQLNHSFSRLVLLLSDQSEHSSFAEGKKLYEQCLKCTEELLNNLASVEDPWEVISKASFGGYGSLDRGASIAAYAGLISLKSGVGNPTDAMIAALMADIGLLDMTPQGTVKLRQRQTNAFHAEEKEIFKKHMVFSLNQCLSRRVPLSENQKNIIMATHEKADGTGFPNALKNEKIPDESYIIQLSEQLDHQTVIVEGQQRPDVKTLRQNLFNQGLEKSGQFPMTFLLKMKEVICATGSQPISNSKPFLSAS